MKWQYYPIPVDDERATAILLENLRAGDKALSRKLLSTYRLGQGTAFAIGMEGLDLDVLSTFSYATYQSGKTWTKAADGQTLQIGDGPVDGLISFLGEFLQGAVNGAVVIQNAVWTRLTPFWESPERLAYCVPTRHVFFENEVYHVITEQDTRHDLMEDTIREAWHKWFVGICSTPVTIPANDSLSEELIDELADGTKHIIVPAFDDEGFLVWCPKSA